MRSSVKRLEKSVYGNVLYLGVERLRQTFCQRETRSPHSLFTLQHMTPHFLKYPCALLDHIDRDSNCKLAEGTIKKEGVMCSRIIV